MRRFVKVPGAANGLDGFVEWMGFGVGEPIKWKSGLRVGEWIKKKKKKQLCFYHKTTALALQTFHRIKRWNSSLHMKYNDFSTSHEKYSRDISVEILSRLFKFPFPFSLNNCFSLRSENVSAIKTVASSKKPRVKRCWYDEECDMRSSLSSSASKSWQPT